MKFWKTEHSEDDLFALSVRVPVLLFVFRVEEAGTGSAERGNVSRANHLY